MKNCVELENAFMYLEPDPQHVGDMNLACNFDAGNVLFWCDNEFQCLQCSHLCPLTRQSLFWT